MLLVLLLIFLTQVVYCCYQGSKPACQQPGTLAESVTC